VAIWVGAVVGVEVLSVIEILVEVAIVSAETWSAEALVIDEEVLTGGYHFYD